MGTDAFRSYYSDRMTEHQNLVSQEIVSKLQRVATKALDRLADRLDVADVADTADVAEMTLKSLGYTSQVKVNVNDNRKQTSVVYISPQAYENARQKMLEVQQSKDTSQHDAEAWRHVTASLDREIGEIEDAVVVESKPEIPERD